MSENLLILFGIVAIVFFIKQLSTFFFCFNHGSRYEKQAKAIGFDPLEIDRYNELSYKADYYELKCSDAVFHLVALFIVIVAIAMYLK